MFDLDSLKAIEHLDRQRLSERLLAFPEELKKYLDAAIKIKKLKSWNNIDKVVILGMGGSGIGSEIAKNLSEAHSLIPVIPVRDSVLPHFVNEKTLVIGVSFSGETKETLLAIRQAISMSAQVILICKENSSLDNMSIDYNLPVFHVTSPDPPRLATPNLLIPILVVLDRVGAVQNIKEDLEESIGQMKNLRDQIKPSKIVEENPAKKLAQAIFSYAPISIAVPRISSVSMRFSQEMNENAKSYAFYYLMPEYCHNMIESHINSDTFFHLAIRTSFETKFDQKSFVATLDILKKKNLPYEEITLQGKSLLSQILYGIYFLDFVSYYCALLKKENPFYIENIELYKKNLSK